MGVTIPRPRPNGWRNNLYTNKTIIWHRIEDLNPYEQFWRLSCYRYINPMYWSVLLRERRIRNRSLGLLAVPVKLAIII